MPVTEHAMQFLQIVQGGACGRQHVTAVVTEDVLFERKVSSRGRHELPHAGSLGAGHCLRVEGAFNEGKQRQFGRHLAPLELFNNVKQVLAGAAGHALDVFRAGAVPLLPICDQVIAQIRHGKTTTNTVPQFLRRLGQGDGVRRYFARGDGLQRCVGNVGRQLFGRGLAWLARDQHRVSGHAELAGFGVAGATCQQYGCGDTRQPVKAPPLKGCALWR